MADGAHPRWVGDQLVLAAQDGDERALVALIEAAHPHVRQFATLLCSTRTDAEDAAQEALLVLFQRIGSLRAVGALSSWTFRIVKNECLRLAREMGKRRDALGREQPISSAEADVFRRLKAERIAAVIAALPDDQRQVLVMRDVYGKSGREVARDLGLSTAAMKSRLHRARAVVKASLLQDGE